LRCGAGFIWVRDVALRWFVVVGWVVGWG